MKPLSLRRIKNTELPDQWGEFLFGPYDEEKRVRALQLIFLFIGSEDEETQRLGYRLALLYSKHTADFSVLHAVASLGGLTPVVKLAESDVERSEINDRENTEDETFVGMFRQSFSEALKEGDIYLTTGQKQLKGLFLNQIDDVVSVVAPTSYGKSSLMSEYLESTDGNFCIIVPTKSLLAQTRRMLLHSLPENILENRKIITHHEMYDPEDEDIIAVLTQERYLQLLQLDTELRFDHLVIDESHNLFDNEGRARALASTLVITLHRQPRACIKFLSPFIANSENLRNRIRDFDIQHLSTREYVKSELIYHIDFRFEKGGRSMQHIYDQFMDRSYPTGSQPNKNPYEYVLYHASAKNIIYLNRPIKTHEVAKFFLNILPEIKSDGIDRACKDLGAYLSKDYLLISCIRKGIIFHHGSVPDNVRLYLENLYATCADIRFVITTSTLLEGVNLPAEKMFLLDIKKGGRNLSASQLKNLIGRVSRFKEVFSANNVNGLLPEVHFVGCEHFPRVTKNLESFLKKNLREDKSAKDKVENPLLAHSELTEAAEAGLYEELSFLGNAEEGVFEEVDHSYATPESEIGRLCFLNRIADFDVLEVEQRMQESVVEMQRLGVMAGDEKQLIEMINMIFLKNLPEGDIHDESSVARLRDNVKARDFYAMILQWRTEGHPYQRMIGQFVGYWKTIEGHRRARIVYAGSWGTRSRDGDPGNPFKKYVDISRLNTPERVTLIIARIEAEMSFLDYNVMKYVDCLRELGLIEAEFLDRLRFGTVDAELKELIQAGMSHSLAQLIAQEDYRKYLIHFPSGAIGLSDKATDLMDKKGINGILVNEARYYTR